MPVMSAIEGAFCRSAPWRSFSRRAVLPWALDGHNLSGEILEIGAGSGAMTAGLAHDFPDALITATDLDSGMVDSARARLTRFPNVAVEVADVTSLPFATARFDSVASFLMLHHVIDWSDALAEVSRVLKPRGVLLGYDLADTRVARWIHRADRSPHCIIAPDELADGLAVAGFTEITVRASLFAHFMQFCARRPS